VTRRAPLPLGTQLLRFVATGGLSAIVDYGLLLALTMAGLDPRLAKVFSFVAGTTTAYLINRRWTFQAGPSRRRFAAVVLLYAITFVINVGLYALVFGWLRTRTGLQPGDGDPDTALLLATTIAFVIAQGVATTVNFVMQRAVIFR